MDIKNKTVLILGGWGLVGSAIARNLMAEGPKKIILTSLKKEEAEDICKDLTKEFKKPKGFFVPWYGNVFVRNEFKDKNRELILKDAGERKKLMHDISDELNDDILHNSALYKMMQQHKPDVVIDCINTATAIAYQNIFKSFTDIQKFMDGAESDYEKLKEAVEKFMCVSYIPQLIRHIQILYYSMTEFKTKFYLKIGTSGTGGMGLNIPYTHSEEKPSRMLLSKSSVAGAHTLLLFLMARTPNGPAVKELKPTASIAWKKIAYGEIKKGGRP
ncbi:MAG: NAD-dependent epimerase/dehydratase family protein, partial [Ignavibacteria bacterium]|nr:NAD-dependent epimerase/dehydratase family protein [Ignavibacteria bacterium]